MKVGKLSLNVANLRMPNQIWSGKWLINYHWRIKSGPARGCSRVFRL